MACRGGEAKAGQTQWQHCGVEHWGVCIALGGGMQKGVCPSPQAATLG